MGEVAKFFADFQRETLLSVATAAPAKVLKVDLKNGLADIQPLFLTCDKEGNIYKQSIIEGALIPDHLLGSDLLANHTCGDPDCTCDSVLNQYSKERELKEGELIAYSVAQRSLDNLNGTNFIDPDSHDIMSSNDAFIIGRYPI